MVLSAMAAGDAKKGTNQCKEGCHKYSMWSAVVAGVSAAIIIIVLVIYIYSYRKQVAAGVQKQLMSMHDSLGSVTGGIPANLGSPFAQASPAVAGQSVPSAAQVLGQVQ